MEKSKQGLKTKYSVKPITGPIDPNADYFVLRLDKYQSDKAHLQACRIAINAYAEAIKESLPLFYNDLIERYPLEITYTQAEVDTLINEERAKFITFQMQNYYSPLRNIGAQKLRKAEQDWTKQYEEIYNNRLAHKQNNPSNRPHPFKLPDQVNLPGLYEEMQKLNIVCALSQQPLNLTIRGTDATNT